MSSKGKDFPSFFSFSFFLVEMVEETKEHEAMVFDEK
jgi:hypothetical protein